MYIASYVIMLKIYHLHNTTTICMANIVDMIYSYSLMKGCSYCVKLQYKIMYYDIPKHLRVGTKIAAIINIVTHFQMICITTYTV